MSMSDNWESCVVTLQEEPTPGHTYTVEVDTINGEACNPYVPFETVELIIFSKYLKESVCDHVLYNCLINGKDCVMGQPAYLTNRAVVYNVPHNTGKRETVNP